MAVPNFLYKTQIQQLTLLPLDQMSRTLYMYSHFIILENVTFRIRIIFQQIFQKGKQRFLNAKSDFPKNIYFN